MEVQLTQAVTSFPCTFLYKMGVNHHNPGALPQDPPAANKGQLLKMAAPLTPPTPASCNIFQICLGPAVLGERLGGGHSPHSFALLGCEFDCFWGGIEAKMRNGIRK